MAPPRDEIHRPGCRSSCGPLICVLAAAAGKNNKTGALLLAGFASGSLQVVPGGSRMSDQARSADQCRLTELWLEMVGTGVDGRRASRPLCLDQTIRHNLASFVYESQARRDSTAVRFCKLGAQGAEFTEQREAPSPQLALDILLALDEPSSAATVRRRIVAEKLLNMDHRREALCIGSSPRVSQCWMVAVKRPDVNRGSARTYRSPGLVWGTRPTFLGRGAPDGGRGHWFGGIIGET